MSWTTVRDINAQVMRLWDRGDLLRSLLDCAPTSSATESTGSGEFSRDDERSCRFPLRLVLKAPSSNELIERFSEVRDWIAELSAHRKIRIEWREFNHRALGVQRVPQSIWIDSLDDAVTMVGKHADAVRFTERAALVAARQPRLKTWVRKRPLQLLTLADECSQLLDVVNWIAQHPQPGIYLRQVDIPGIHSKFIEDRRGVLTEWLDQVLPTDAIVADATGASRFAARYGFSEKPVRIRFRVLDPAIVLFRGPALPDVTLDAASFATLDAEIRHVFVTENEVNFLAFPRAPGAIVVFGAGYGWDAFTQAPWLSGCVVHYWGDVDTHGFAILDQLRHRLAHVESFLMDRSTLMAHRDLWGEEANQVSHDLSRLTNPERELYDDLRDNRIRRNLRLEQEHIGYEWIERAIGG
jgi:hypothetical protein